MLSNPKPFERPIPALGNSGGLIWLRGRRVRYDGGWLRLVVRISRRRIAFAGCPTTSIFRHWQSFFLLVGRCSSCINATARPWGRRNEDDDKNNDESQRQRNYSPQFCCGSGAGIVRSSRIRHVSASLAKSIPEPIRQLGNGIYLLNHRLYVVFQSEELHILGLGIQNGVTRSRIKISGLPD